jgi:polyribonucleotide nucleotidyltransferase
VEHVGKPKRPVTFFTFPARLQQLFQETVTQEGKLAATLSTGKPGSQALNELKEAWLVLAQATLPPEEASLAGPLFEEEADATLRRLVVEEGMRPDGRAFNELRTVKAYTNLIAPMTHGAGIFYRGDTHVFSALTLGGPGDAQILETIEYGSVPKRFMHHYNFPPYSTGEVGRLGGVNRRAVGHGALAERALLPVIPPKETFPYTIRVVSEVMSSNGSSSMASVCASSLALMDGGVPVARHVAGIAMGLMLWKGKHVVLTDIQGPEDHHGDMDFKVAGTRNGITAIQMDVKVEGVPIPILSEALQQAKEARHAILDVMEAAIAAPRPELSPLAPRIVSLTIPKDMIGLVIGPAGKTINGIKDRTGVDDITIENDGIVYIAGNREAVERAKTEVEDLTRAFAVGDRLEGEVVRLTDFGAFVKIGPNAEGLVHISEIAPFRIEKVEDVLTVGERVPVVVKGIDEKDRISLSIKMADPDFARRKGITPYYNHRPSNHQDRGNSHSHRRQ